MSNELLEQSPPAAIHPLVAQQQETFSTHDNKRDKETAATDTANNNSNTHQPATFVDYVALPQVRVLPPAKYKLWLLVWICVYLASWLGSEARLSQALRLRGWLAPNAALFVQLAMIVFVMVYATLDLVVALCTFECKGREYGLGAWLKAGRAKWMYKFSERNVLVQLLAMIVWKLEDGFSMFDVNQGRLNVTSTHVRGKRSKNVSSRSNTTASSTNSDAAATADKDDEPLQPQDHVWQTSQLPPDVARAEYEYEQEDSETEADLLHCESEDCNVLLRIEHRVDPHKLPQYERWKLKITRAVKQQRGFIEITCHDMTTAAASANENEQVVAVSAVNDDNGNQQLDVEQAGVTIHDPIDTSFLHVVYCTFANISYLNEWLLSPRRKALMKELSPLLVRPDVVQIQRDRVLPDAFTDLVIAQGECAPTMPPKKWKVWWLTTLALFCTIRWTRSFMPYYYEFWGLTEQHLQTLVGTCVSTLLNSYVMVPLLLFLFNPWMQRHKDEKDDREPWRTMEDGLQSLWMKALLTFAYFGGCAIAWIVRSQTS
ncbi:hypothetical protein MPSEU_000422500 [Mayamaea pseudoterrestris]|nr:hypothetical protein MPSEU_000422500 [Mayamaea pseudoterrestris]